MLCRRRRRSLKAEPRAWQLVARADDQLTNFNDSIQERQERRLGERFPIFAIWYICLGLIHNIQFVLSSFRSIHSYTS